MKIKVQKWGNSLGLRIPKVIAEEIGLKENTPVELSLKKKKIVISPIKSEITLKKLLSQVTEENLHREVDTGLPKGWEIFASCGGPSSTL